MSGRNVAGRVVAERLAIEPFLAAAAPRDALQAPPSYARANSRRPQPAPFSDDERARDGTLYKQRGRQQP